VVNGDGTKRPAVKAAEPKTEKPAQEYVDTAVLLVELTKGMGLMVQGIGSLNRSIKALDEKVDCLSEEIEYLAQVVMLPPAEQD
jgi:hypothetical protein